MEDAAAQWILERCTVMHFEEICILFRELETFFVVCLKNVVCGCLDVIFMVHYVFFGAKSRSMN